MRGYSWTAGIVVCAPAVAQAAPAEELETIEHLYDEGRALYDTADYDGAISKWTEAYTMVGDAPEHTEIRVTLLYNLASAHEAAFDIDGDATHLNKARVLLERFDQNIDELYEGDDAVEERQRVRERIAAIDEKLGAGEAEPEPEPEPEPETTPEPEASEGPPAAGPDEQPPSKRDRGGPHKGLLASGAVFTGLGLAGVGLGIGAMVQAEAANDFDEETLGVAQAALDLRHEQIARGKLMNTLTYVGFAAGGAMLVTGVTLIALSLRKRSSGRRAALAPMLAPTQAGLLVRGSF